MIRASLLRCGAIALGCMVVVTMVTTVGRERAEAAPTTISAVRARMSTAMEGLLRFKQSGDFEDILRASHDLRGAMGFSELTTFSANDLLSLRRVYVTDYTQLLAAIDRLEDPAFVATDDRYRPRICFMPPREPNGHQAPPCADPNEITDPATRAAYVAALQANAERNRQIGEQRRLRGYEEEVTSEFQVLLKSFHWHVPDDTAALDAIVRGAGIRETKKAAILAMMTPS